MNSSRSQNPFYLVLLTVGLLGLLSFVKSGFSVAGFELRRVNLLADVLRKKPRRLVATLPPPNGPAAPAPAVGKAASPQPSPAATAAVADAPEADADEESTPAQPAVANLSGLDAFIAALHRTKADGSPVRIAYFGDSMIEGDMITGVGSSRVDLQACKLEYSIVSPK